MADVALDMDGVIADFFGWLFQVYAQRHGRQYSVDEVTAHDLAQSVGWVVYRDMAAIFNEPGFFSSIKPYPGAIEVVNLLIDAGYHVEICTSPTVVRSPNGGKKINASSVHEKIEWIDKYLPRLAKQITVTKNKRLLKADYLVDDAEHNIVPWCAAHPAGTGLVVSQPWNSSMVLPPNARRTTIYELPRLLGVR